MSDALLAALRRAWRDAAAVAPGPRTWRAVRVPCPGPMTVLAAIRERDGTTGLLFEAPIENAPAERARFEAHGISVLEDRNYPERIYRIAVALERPDLDNLFGILSVDLVEAAQPHAVHAAAVAAIFNRLSAWQAFLRLRHSGLGREALIGLIGELLVLRRLAAVTSWSAAVDAWKGPTGGLHDFLRAGQGLEVKTAAGIASAIEISSIDQLENAGLAALVLAHVHLAEVPGGRTLPALAAGVADDIARNDPAAIRPYRDALLASGYADVDADLYQTPSFQPLTIRFYLVGDGFPRLTSRTVPQGIVAATYRLDVRALQTHLIDDTAADGFMAQMGDQP